MTTWSRVVGVLRARFATVVAALVLLVGIVEVASVLTPHFRDRMRVAIQSLGGVSVHSAAALALVSGCLLVVVSHGLRRRKARAWRIAVGLLSVTAALNIAKGLNFEESAVALVVLAVLVSARGQFTAASDPRSRIQAPFAFVGLTIASTGLGLAALQLRSSRLVGPHPLSSQAEQVILGLIGVPGPLRFASDGVSDLFFRLFLGLGLFTLLVTAYLVLRPAEPLATLSAKDEWELRGLLDLHGEADSLGYFALRRDKAVVWSPSRKAAVSYRVVSGVMLASGDPLGDIEAWPGAIERFLEIAREHAWTPAVMGCSERAGTVWSRAGLDALELGDEAVVDVSTFSLEGRSMRNVRQAVARADRAGYAVDVRRLRELPPAELGEVQAAVRRWRGTKTERGFSMALGRLGDAADGNAVVVRALHNGQLAGVLHFVPWGTDGLSLDLMVRDRSADNGLNELLITRLLAEAPRLGVEHVSLNFAMFRAALARGERLGAGFVLRLWCGVLRLLSRWFQIESLYKFNAKFQPTWVPRYVCYPRARDLARIGLAALEAEAFIVWPTPRREASRPSIRGVDASLKA